MRRCLVVLLAALGGCGGGAPSAERDPGYRAEAARACASADEAFDRIGPRTGEDLLTVAGEAWRDAVTTLAGIRAPQALRAEHERVVQAARDLEQNLQRTARRVGRTTRADELSETAIRTRSAADSLKVAAGLVKVQGCGDAAIGAADRLLTRPYAALARHSVVAYRRIMRKVDFTPDTPETARRSAVALFDAALVLDRGAGVLEPPRGLTRAHQRMLDAIDAPREITLPIGVRTERVGPDRMLRILRRAAPAVRRLERAQRALLAETERVLRAKPAPSPAGAQA